MLHRVGYKCSVALEELKKRKKKLNLVDEWTNDEKKIFNEGIKKFGKEPNLIKSMVFFIYYFFLKKSMIFFLKKNKIK